MNHVCPNNAWPTGHPLPPIDPAKLTGPAVGSVVRYDEPRYPQWDRLLMRIKESSYVWSPGECRHGGGYRRYDWSVVEWPVLGRAGAVVWKTMVVDNDKLTVIE